MDIKLANPRGFCAGVDRAIDIVNRALDLYGAPVYVRHEVVHNKFVVDSLRQRGAVFVEELDEVPDGSLVIFSAHGVSQQVQLEAKSRDLKVFDATCPLVTKVHKEVQHQSDLAGDVVLIGHEGHPEVEGTMGQFSGKSGGSIFLVELVEDVNKLQVNDVENVTYVTQTTLSVDDTSQVIKALKEKYPAISEPRKNDICYATQNRQDAVKTLAQECELVLVVGSPNSSNSNRLRELAERCGATSYLIDNASEIEESWLAGVKTVGVTAGASAPESLVTEVLERLSQLGGGSHTELPGEEENVIFSMPKELRVKRS
ncbi:MAG: 4-hydroxy-3-methylbut-2-enyl diphosphate reductase [Gammaproteobacteria bacterium]|nr:4-hydroxy-3-methylbut-2-enyl diphosphate reductase [Gammaproteobacteria bacterium]